MWLSRSRTRATGMSRAFSSMRPTRQARIEKKELAERTALRAMRSMLLPTSSNVSRWVMALKALELTLPSAESWISRWTMRNAEVALGSQWPAVTLTSVSRCSGDGKVNPLKPAFQNDV